MFINSLIHLRKSLSLSRTNQIPHSPDHSHLHLPSHNKYNRKRNLAGRLLLDPVHLYPPRVRFMQCRLPSKSNRQSLLLIQRARHRLQVLRPRGFTLARVPVPCRVRVRVRPKRANTSEVCPSTRWVSERFLARLLPRSILPPKLLVRPPRVPRQPFTLPFLKSRDRLLADPRRCRSHRHPRVARQSKLLPRRRPCLVLTTARRTVAAR
jgi:hypothetical protein